MTLRHWARVWSPVVPAAETHAAWCDLDLPGTPEAAQADFIGTFHVGVPAPPVPLLLHHTLNLPGDAAREDWLRVMAWLGLELGEVRLPPDHLAIACEVISVAAERGERVIVDELLGRYVTPWCTTALARLERSGSDLVPIARRFASDVASCACP